MPASLVPASFSPKPTQPPPQPKPVPIAIMEKPKAKNAKIIQKTQKQKKRIYQKKIQSPISDRSNPSIRSEDEDSYSYYSSSDSDSASYYTEDGL